MFGDMDEGILKFVNDYKLNLILPNEIEDFSKFTSEFGKAMKYIAVSKDNEAYRKTTEDKYYGNISVETARLLNECAGTKIPVKKKEETVMMCKAWADQEAKGIEKGKEIGEARALIGIVENVQKNMNCTLEEALRTVGKSLEDYEKAKKLIESE